MTKKPRNRSLIALLLTLAMLLSLVPSTAFAQKIEVSRADFFGFEKPVLTSTKDNNYFTNLIKTTSRDPYRVEFVALKKEGGATVALPHTFTQEGNYIAEYKVIIDGTNFANHMFSANPVWAVKTITGKQINSSTPAITQNTGDNSSFIMSVPFKVENEVLLNAPPTNLRIDVASDSVKAKFDAPQSNKAYSAKLYLLRNGEPHPIDMSDTIEKNIMANAPQNTEEWNITDKVKKSGKYTVVLVYKPEGSSDYLYGSKMESTIYEPQAYPLTITDGGVLGGSPDNKYVPGEQLRIAAADPPAGQVFDKWEVVSGTVTLADATQRVTTFTMPASPVTLKATYKTVKYLVTLENGTLANSPPADGKYAQGETVSIVANPTPPGQVFDKWVVVNGTGVVFADETSAQTSFTMPANEVKVKATYKLAATKYLVTVENGTLANNPPADGKYAQGATVTVQANAAPSGQVFDKWEVVSGGVTLANATQVSTTFTMPANEVKVKATYKNAPAAPTTYAVTVLDGTGGGNYAQNATVTITANAASAGKIFDKWEVLEGNVTLGNTTHSTTTFSMPANAVKVKAVYRDLVAPSMTSSSTYYHPELNNQPSKKPDVPKVKPSSTKPKAPEVTESGKANAKNLTDINNHWANSAITYCVERNIMRGMSEKTFAPNTSVTRGMFVTILGNLSEVDKASYNVGKFSDSVGKYYSPYVNWANETGIAQGVSSDKFMPNTAITREQLAVMIVKYAKHANIELGSNSPQKFFTDADNISPWAKDAVSTLQMSGLMEGQKDNLFNPKAKATRAEVCLIMQKLTMLIK